MMPPGKPVELNRIPRDPVERLEDPLAQYDPNDVRAVVAEVKELRDEIKENDWVIQVLRRQRDDAESMIDQIVDAINSLHYPVEITLYGGGTRWVCNHSVSSTWPCPTVKAVKGYIDE